GVARAPERTPAVPAGGVHHRLDARPDVPGRGEPDQLDTPVGVGARAHRQPTPARRLGPTRPGATTGRGLLAAQQVADPARPHQPTPGGPPPMGAIGMGSPTVKKPGGPLNNNRFADPDPIPVNTPLVDR